MHRDRQVHQDERCSRHPDEDHSRSDWERGEAHCRAIRQAVAESFCRTQKPRDRLQAAVESVGQKPMSDAREGVPDVREAAQPARLIAVQRQRLRLRVVPRDERARWGPVDYS